MATLIAHTGYDEEEHVQRAKEAGFDHQLVKPADLRRVGEIASLCRDRHVRSDNEYPDKCVTLVLSTMVWRGRGAISH